MAILFLLLAVPLFAHEAPSTPPAVADWLQPYNVVWDSPSKDSSGSMPLGNGNIVAMSSYAPLLNNVGYRRGTL